MTLSMYNASVPALKRMLSSLAGTHGKSAEHAASKKIDPGVFINARLFPEMFPLSRQIQIATDQAKGCAARLGSVDIPRFEDDETSIEALQMCIAKTIAFLDSFKAQQIDGSEERDIERPPAFDPDAFKRFDIAFVDSGRLGESRYGSIETRLADQVQRGVGRTIGVIS